MVCLEDFGLVVQVLDLRFCLYCTEFSDGLPKDSRETLIMTMIIPCVKVLYGKLTELDQDC